MQTEKVVSLDHPSLSKKNKGCGRGQIVYTDQEILNCIYQDTFNRPGVECSPKNNQKYLFIAPITKEDWTELRDFLSQEAIPILRDTSCYHKKIFEGLIAPIESELNFTDCSICENLSSCQKLCDENKKYVNEMTKDPLDYCHRYNSVPVSPI